MQYRQLGGSGLMVSVLGVGTTGWGAHGEFGDVDAAGAQRQVGIALDAGVNLFDTAETYGSGHCEELLGAALAGRREDAVIATKVFFGVSGGPNDHGLSRAHIIRSCEGSLRRMRTDYVDVLQMHGWDGRVRLEETVSAVDSLVQAGKVRYWGVSNWSAWHLMKALGVAAQKGLSGPACQQIYYSLQAREAEHELVPLSLDQGVGILVWSPLGGALLTGKWRRGQPPPADSRRMLGWPDPPIYDVERLWATIDVLTEIAADRDCTVPQLALAYLLHKAGVSALIIGARSEAQLSENLRAAELDLRAEELARLDEVSATPLLYPYWWQAKYDDRLGPADLAVLARYQDVAFTEGGLHRPLPGFGTIPGS